MPRSISELEKYLDREFGPIDNLVDQTERRSRVILDENPGADLTALKDTVGDRAGRSGPALPELERQPFQQRQEGSMDRTRLFGAGVMDLGEMAVGAVEYGARQSKYTRDSIAPALEKVRGGISEIREGILSGVSPEYLDRVGKEIMTLDPSKSLWRSGNPIEVADAIYGKFVRSLPSTLAVMLPAARLFRIGNSAGALTYLGASEGGLSVGAIANNLTDEIKGMTNEELLKESPRYAEIYQQVGGDEAEARSRFTAEAQGIAPLVGGMAVAGISLATGRLLKPVFDPGDAAKKGLNLGQRIGRGFLAEAPQEGSQGVSEQMAQNFAAKVYDENRPLMEGALEAFGQEGLIGGLTGAAVSGAFGTRPQKPLPPPIEDENAQLTLPGFGPQQPGGGTTPAIEEARGPIVPDEEVDNTKDFLDRQGELDLGAGTDLDTRRTYTTRDGEVRELPPDMQRVGRDTSRSTEFTLVGPPSTAMDVDESGQGQLPLRDRAPLRDRVPGDRRLPPGAPIEGPRQVPYTTRGGDQRTAEIMPDEMDQPTAEPLADIEAQLADFANKGGRKAVYLSPEQRNAPRQVPKGAKVIPNWDGRGGTMIFKNAAAARVGAELVRKVRNGQLTWQEAIGQLTLAGRGKPVEGRYVVQLLDGAGNVARESMVPNLTKAQALREKWKGDGKVRITTPDAAVRRRGVLAEQTLDTDREPVTKESGVTYQTRGEEDGQMTFPGMEATRQGVAVSEGTVPSQELDQRQLEIEDEITRRKGEQEAAERQRKQEEEQQAREEYERKRRFEEESQQPFDPAITEEEIDALARYYVRMSRLVETADGWLDTEAVDEEYGSYEEAEAAAAEIREQNKALLRERGLPESKKQFRDYLKEQKKRVAEDDPPEDNEGKLTESELAEKRIKWAQDNKGKLTKSEFADLQKRVRELGKKMYGGDPKVEGTDELDIKFEQAVRAFADRQPVTEEPYFDERPTDKRAPVFDEQNQGTGSSGFVGKAGRVQDPAKYSTKEEAEAIDPDAERKRLEQEGKKEKKLKGMKLTKTTDIDPETKKDRTVWLHKRSGRKFLKKTSEETLIHPKTKKPYKVPKVEWEEVTTEKAPRETTVEKQLRKDYSTPAEKQKLIRRERRNQLRAAQDVRAVKDTKVVVDEKGKTTGTKPLVYDAIKTEETKAEVLARQAKVKEANTRLRNALNRAKRFIKRFETSGAFGIYKGTQFEKAKQHYKEFVQLAETLLNPRLYQAQYTETYEAQTQEAAEYFVVYAGVKTESAYKTGETTKLRPFATTTSREAANKYAQQLQEEGVVGVEIRSEVGMQSGTKTYQRVALKTFPDRKSAETFLRREAGMDEKTAASSVNIIKTAPESAGQASTATEVAKVLESATMGMTPESFTKKFATLSDKQERLQARELPSNRKESRAQKQAKVKKGVAERRSRSKWQAIRQAWRNNTRFQKTIAPVFSKIANVALENYYNLQSGVAREKTYTPTFDEIEQINDTLQAWRKKQSRKNQDIFYKPMVDELTRLGFEFFDDGNLKGYTPPTSQAKEVDFIQVPTGYGDIARAERQPDFVGPRQPVNTEVRTGLGEGWALAQPVRVRQSTLSSQNQTPFFEDPAANPIGTLPKPKKVKIEKPELAAESREEYRALQEERKQKAKERQEKKEHHSTRKARTRRMSRAESERQKTPGSRRAEINERMEIAENRAVIRKIEAYNALVERFKERVAHSKTRNVDIKKEEYRLLQALKNLGIWRIKEGNSVGVIDIDGWVQKSYRPVGPRIPPNNRKVNEKKGEVTGKRAKELISSQLGRISVPSKLSGTRLQTRRRDPDTKKILPGYPSVYADETAQILEDSDSYEIGPDDSAYDLFMKGINLEENTPELDAAASEVGDMIRDRNSTQPINDVLDAIIRNLPENHFYSRLAKKLRSMDMGQPQIHYDWLGKKFKGRKKNNWGLYDPNDGRIYLNRRVMGENMDQLTGAKAVHTILHETLHAATAAELQTNTQLRNYFLQVRGAARLAWQERNGKGKMPYGLRVETNEDGVSTPVDEFVAEVFANQDLQNFLKSVPMPTPGQTGLVASAWSVVKNALVRLLGWSNVPQIETLFDAFMAPADMVFQSAGQLSKGHDMNYFGDEVVEKVTNTFVSKWQQRDQIWKRMKERAKNPSIRFSSFAMNLQTMEQFNEVYQQYFNFVDDDGNAVNPMKKYYDAWQRRIGKSSERMERPTELSGEWTSLEESNPDEALEMSRIMSNAGLYNITASDPIDAETNEHLTSDDQKARHENLHTRFKRLSPKAQKLYRDVRAYYKGAIKEEQKFLLQSGVRGITGVELSEADIDKLETKKDLDELLKEHINDNERAEYIDTLWNIAQIPVRRKGDYFPAMRYGDNVAYAEFESGREVFEDEQAARERRAEIAATDPTLDVHYTKNEDGKWDVVTMVRDFRMAETKSEIMREWEDLKQMYDEKHVAGPQKRRKLNAQDGIGSNTQLNSILKALSGDAHAQAAIKNFYLRNLSDQSMRKHELTSKNRRGLNHDIQHRNLATYARQSSYYISQLEFGWKMSEAVAEMDHYISRRQGADTFGISEVKEHLKKRDKMSQILPEVSALVRTGVEGTHFFMLTSPSYWAINATQPWMVTMPQLAGRFGWGSSYAKMHETMRMISPILGKQAIKTRLGVKALTDRELREESFNIIDQLLEDIKLNTSAEQFKEFETLIKDLRQRNIVDINVFTEMRELAAGKVGNRPVRNAWTGVVDASRVMAHLTEVNNRILTSLTAYQLARDAGDSVEVATEYAAKITSTTQFNYSTENKPPLFQAGGPLGPLAPLMFQFMQWPQHMYAQLIRNYAGMVEAGVMNKSEARTALLGTLGTHMAVGGMVGMTLQPIKWAMGMVMMAFGDEDEPYTLANALSGQTFDQLMAEVAADVFGTTLGTFVTKGIPAGFGIDLSTRMSMGTLYFIDLRGDTPQSVMGSLLASFGGATLNQGLNFSRGLGYAMDGDYLRGIETASPKFARDVLRAVRYAREGIVNSNGDTVVDASDMSIGEILAQSVGFAPTTVSDFYDAQQAIKGKEQFVLKRRERLLKDFRTAPTGIDRARVMREIRGFNRGNRQEAITVDALWSTWEAKFKREYRYRRLGANIDEEKARFYREYGEPYRD